MEDNKIEVKEANLNVEEEIAKLKAEKEAIVKAQEEQSKQMEELAKLKAEIEELKSFKFPNEIKSVVKENPIELIQKKFDRLTYAINNFELGHPERAPFTQHDNYNGTRLLEGYYRYTQGEKIEDIFKNPLE